MDFAGFRGSCTRGIEPEHGSSPRTNTTEHEPAHEHERVHEDEIVVYSPSVLRGEALADAIAAKAPADRDRYVNELLGIPEPGSLSSVAAFDSELVQCLPSGVAAIADAILKASIGPCDVLMDLGSGTGRVPILVHLLTGARAIGVELDDHLVRASREHVERLGLSQVEIIHGDARAVDLDIANVYYLYVPFVGSALRTVLDQLALVARKKQIAIASLGIDLGKESWLRTVDDSAFLLTIYESLFDGASPRRPDPSTIPSLATIAMERSQGSL